MSVPQPIPRPPSLRRELMVILALKLLLIAAIKLAFFSQPLQPGEAGTARAVLASSPASPSASTTPSAPTSREVRHE